MVAKVLTSCGDDRADPFMKEPGMLVDQHLYRKAFQAYLRNGTPIEWSIKQERPTTHYIWRTRDDDKVRSSHAANDGQIFAWDNPPPTGHPGEDFGCRCTAEPYSPEFVEHITITLSGVSDSGSPWSSRDFVRHYYRGRGRGVTVRETGHLQSVDQYMNTVQRKLQDNIAEKARENPGDAFADVFYNSYNMTWIVFSIGGTTIGGSFSGRASEEAGVLVISGELDFYLRDEFVDPLDIGVEVIDLGETILENLIKPLDAHLRALSGLPPTGRPPILGIHTGEPYAITDEWSGRFEGQVYADPQKSIYFEQED